METRAQEVEITPEMTRAGVEAYYQSPFEPNEEEIAIIARLIFYAMSKAQKFCS